MLLKLILINIAFILYSIIDGAKEGFYDYYKNDSKSLKEFHTGPIFNFQRCLLMIGTIILMIYAIGWISLFNFVCLLFMFKFFQNGSYYYIRNKIDNNIYKKRWKDEDLKERIKKNHTLTTYKKRTISIYIAIIAQIIMYMMMIL